MTETPPPALSWPVVTYAFVPEIAISNGLGVMEPCHCFVTVFVARSMTEKVVRPPTTYAFVPEMAMAEGWESGMGMVVSTQGETLLFEEDPELELRRVHTDGAPEQSQPLSTEQVAEQPSPLVLLPSSHRSPISKMPLPQIWIGVEEVEEADEREDEDTEDDEEEREDEVAHTVLVVRSMRETKPGYSFTT